MHKLKPTQTSESPLSADLMDKLANSDYTKGLDTLQTHVAGHRVINSATGNAGFVLYLDNNSWALAYRTDNKISSEFGSGLITNASINKIHSTKLGDASDASIDDSPYANERNSVENEVRKSHGKLIEGLSIGDNTFNFAFEEGMELDFELCNDNKNIPAIRVFWEQW